MESAKWASVRVPISEVDVILHRNPFSVIYETGVSGTAPTGHVIVISLDPNNANFGASIDVELSATLIHELHHCMRWRGPGCGKTLRDALVSEGLALHFEREYRNAPPFYAVSVPERLLREVKDKAKDELDSESYDYSAWFYGSETRGIPRHAGYSLGYDIVGSYLRIHNTSAAKVWSAPAINFIF